MPATVKTQAAPSPRRPPVSDYTDRWRRAPGETGPNAQQQAFEQLRVGAHNATAGVVNSVASFGSAMWHHPGDAIMFVGGAVLAAHGLFSAATGAAACVASVGTGCAAVAAPVAGALALTAVGAAAWTLGAQRLIGYASTENNIQIMQREDGAFSDSGADATGESLGSVDDIMANPRILEGRTPAQVRSALGDTPGWESGTLTRGRSAGSGWTFRERNSAGTDYTGRYIQWSPGSPRHFGGLPYWKVSSGTSGTVRFPQ